MDRLVKPVLKVHQLLAHGRWFSPGTPASSTTKTGRHDTAESGVKHQKSIFILICFFFLFLSIFTVGQKS
jgi:hypothetical protein